MEITKGKILELANPEKKLQEKWCADRDLFDFPRPFRWILCGSPGSGKTSLILNYLIHTQVDKSTLKKIKGSFDQIFLLHPKNFVSDLDATADIIGPLEVTPAEYEGVAVHNMYCLPSEGFWAAGSRKERRLLIIDDIDLLSWQKRNVSRQRIVNKLMSYNSTHNNLSIIVTSQSPSTQLPPIVMQMCNLITMYKVTDKYKLRVLAQKLSLEIKSLCKYMAMLKSPHDTLTIDAIPNSPMPLRINIYDPLEIESAVTPVSPVGSLRAR
jgi:hypothetical protein